MAKTLQEIMSSDIEDILFTDFALDAAFSHAGGQASTIKVIFDNDFKAVNIDTGMVESAGPMATCKTSDVLTAAHGDTLTINSVVYKIIGIEPDGTGMTTLILSKD